MEIKNKVKNPYKVKTVEKAVKDVDLSDRIVSGVFNSYFYIDSDLDMLLPGAASKSIQERGVGSTKGNRIKHLKDHDWSQNIARLDVLEEREVDFSGRKIQGIYHESFYPESTDSTDMLIKIQEGLYDSRSIGFQYIENGIQRVEKGSDDYNKFIQMAINPEAGEEAGYFYVVKEIKLWEGSDVSFGANELTPLLGVKSGDRDILQRKLFEKLDICQGLFKKGSMSDDGFHQLEMEINQIKSYIALLNDQKPSKKDTSEPSRQNKNTSGSDFIKALIN